VGVLPDTLDIRQHIESVDKEAYQLCLKYIYLIDGRVSEAISRVSPSERAKKKTQPRGPKGGDFSIHDYNNAEAVVFQVNTAKRGGLVRACAVPIEREYEPWAGEVVTYFEKFDRNDSIFNFTRQKLWVVAKETFGDITYPIEEYERIIEGEKLKIERHPRLFRIHALRHARATDLILYYGFDGMDLSQFGGWTLRTMLGVGSAISRYAHLDWRRYFHKLLKKRF